MKTFIVFIAILHSVTLSAQERITLLFVGDLMQHQKQIEAARTPQGTYNYSPCFSQVREQLSQADLAIGNLEVTLAGKPYTGYPAFSAPDEFLQSIKEAGFDILLTANNHCLDRRSKGLERTIQMLDSLSIPYAGTYRTLAERKQRYPLFIKKKGFLIAILNYTYGTNGIKVTPPNVVNYIDKEIIRQDILSAKARRPDAIIACMHWGAEYQPLPNRDQQELADWLLQQGVSHIIGSHPHVLQPMELRTGKNGRHVIVYSLGNFISNMSAPHTDGGAIFTMELEKYPLPSPVCPPQMTMKRTLSYHPAIFAVPYCRIVNCGYDLVWTARPNLTQEKNFILHPFYLSADSLPLPARNRLNIFMKNSQALLQQHNIGIPMNKKEEPTTKKTSNSLLNKK